MNTRNTADLHDLISSVKAICTVWRHTGRKTGTLTVRRLYSTADSMKVNYSTHKDLLIHFYTVYYICESDSGMYPEIIKSRNMTLNFVENRTQFYLSNCCSQLSTSEVE